MCMSSGHFSPHLGCLTLRSSSLRFVLVMKWIYWFGSSFHGSRDFNQHLELAMFRFKIHKMRLAKSWWQITNKQEKLEHNESIYCTPYLCERLLQNNE
jgi:hypothetical protein